MSRMLFAWELGTNPKRALGQVPDLDADTIGDSFHAAVNDDAWRTVA